jgi:hypothetical protein
MPHGHDRNAQRAAHSSSDKSAEVKMTVPKPLRGCADSHCGQENGPAREQGIRQGGTSFLLPMSYPAHLGSQANNHVRTYDYSLRSPLVKVCLTPRTSDAGVPSFWLRAWIRPNADWGLPELAHALDGQADTAQRFVVVVALGLTLGIVASYLTSLRRTGWYAYAPLSGQVFQQQGIGEPGWLRLIIWLAAISLWALASLRVLRQSPVQATPK